jgi:hypothetical protein
VEQLLAIAVEYRLAASVAESPPVVAAASMAAVAATVAADTGKYRHR